MYSSYISKIRRNIAFVILAALLPSISFGFDRQRCIDAEDDSSHNMGGLISTTGSSSSTGPCTLIQSGKSIRRDFVKINEVKIKEEIVKTVNGDYLKALANVYNCENGFTGKSPEFLTQLTSQMKSKISENSDEFFLDIEALGFKFCSPKAFII